MLSNVLVQPVLHRYALSNIAFPWPEKTSAKVKYIVTFRGDEWKELIKYQIGYP